MLLTDFVPVAVIEKFRQLGAVQFCHASHWDDDPGIIYFFRKGGGEIGYWCQAFPDQYMEAIRGRIWDEAFKNRYIFEDIPQ